MGARPSFSELRQISQAVAIQRGLILHVGNDPDAISAAQQIVSVLSAGTPEQLEERSDRIEQHTGQSW